MMVLKMVFRGSVSKSLLLVAWSATVAGVFLARAEDFVDDRLVNLPVPSSCRHRLGSVCCDQASVLQGRLYQRRAELSTSGLAPKLRRDATSDLQKLWTLLSSQVAEGTGLVPVGVCSSENQKLLIGCNGSSVSGFMTPTYCKTTAVCAPRLPIKAGLDCS